MSVKLAYGGDEVALRTGESNGVVLIAIWIWGLASFVIILTLGTSRDLRYRLGRYYSLVERTAWVSALACLPGSSSSSPSVIKASAQQKPQHWDVTSLG
jgi:hypothetical protein